MEDNHKKATLQHWIHMNKITSGRCQDRGYTVPSVTGDEHRGALTFKGTVKTGPITKYRYPELIISVYS